MTLDNPALAGRSKPGNGRRSLYERRAVVPVRSRFMSDIRPAAKPVVQVKPKLKPAIIRYAAASPSPRLSRSQVLKREAVQRTRRLSAKRRPSRGLGSKALTVFAVILFMFGLAVGINGLRQNQKVAAQVQEISNKVDEAADEGDGAQTGDVPSENQPGDVGSYRVAPTMPRKLSIDKIGVHARVVRLGVNADNQIKAPANIFDTAWFEGSAKPGELGAVLINGHVHGPTQPGVFIDLKKLQKGDIISLERGDGKVFTYSVVASKTYDADKVDMGAALSSITPGKPGLNLITCTGQLDKTNNQYKQRLVVFAVQN